MIEQDQWFAICPPRASNKGQVGGMVAVAVTTGTGVIDLTKLLAQAKNLATNGGRQAGGVVGQFITIEADGADVGIVFGKAIADVTGGNAPSLTAVGTVDASGIYTDAAGICFRIPSGQNISVRPQLKTDLFLGFVGSAAGFLRIFQSSPPGSVSSP